MIRKYALVFIALLCSFFYGFGQTPWINEIHYDNNGGDLNEGVEVAVPTGYSCVGTLEVVPYNGGNGQEYSATNVPTTGGTTSNGITFYWVAIGGLQNGAPDGLALVCNGSVIQFLSYEGSFTATNGPANGLTSTDIGVSEAGNSPIGQSLQLQGSGCQYSDFSWVGSSAHSRNIVNSTQTINCSTSDLSISGTPTDHGSTCVNTAATTRQYTITNNGAIPALVDVNSDNTEFAISGYTTQTINPGASATYDVTFTPTTAGAKTATITVSSATTSDATSDLTGTGLAVTAQAVTSNAATAVAGTTATVNGNVTTLGTCPNTTEKGFVYSETSLNANPLVGGANVTSTTVAGLTTGAYNLGLTGLNTGTQYSFKAYVYNGTTYTYGTVLTFTTTTPPVNDDCSNATNLIIGAAPTTGTLTSATPTSGNTFAYQSSKNDVWYTFTPTCTGTHTVTLTFASGPDIDFDIFPSVCPTTGTAPNTAHGTGTTETVTATFNSGTTYSIRVIDYNTSASTFNINVAALTPVLTTQPVDITRAIPAAGTFSVASPSTPGATYQWEVSTNGGASWVNAPGATATNATYNTGATDATMNGYQYRCIVTNACLSVTSNAATLTLTNPIPNNVTAIRGCFEDDRVTLNWTAPATGTTPTGYVVFAIDGGVDPAGAKTDASTYTADSNFSTATTVTPASLGKVVYKGAGTTTTVTGLTEDNNYSITVYAYVGETLTGWAAGATNGSTVTNSLAQGDIRNLTASPDNTQVTLNWNNPLPTSCFDELIIVANQGNNVTFNPTGTYAPINVNYTTPDEVVYATTTTVSSKVIAGLVNNVNACFKIYIRRGTTWSDGVEICETPIITYCDATSNSDAFNTGITGVVFNTINNTGTSPNNTYVDYTNLSTNVEIGTSYDLSMNVNVDGNGTVYSRVWIDWNIDGDFNDSNEEYDLGTLYNPSNSVDLDGATSESPLSIEIPSNALTGTTRMRVASKWGSYPTSCEDNYSGEIEDYSLVITQPSNAEINIKGNNITIPNGFNAPYGLNNTLFGATDLTGPYIEKSYFISNLGLSQLNLTNNPIIEIIGTNPGDFVVTQQPSASSIASGASDLEFKIEFRPTSTGIRNAQVRIYNNDSTGNENPYIFDIRGTGTCSTTIISNIWPFEGPENTEVTITSATDLTGALAELNGVTMPIVSSAVGELIVTVPPSATDGNLIVTFSTGCTSTNSFDVIDTAIAGCDNASSNTLGELFISEVTDATSGSSSFVEIYNGTPNTINLSDYSVNVYNNGSASPSSVNSLTGNLVSGGVYVVSIGTTSCTLNNLSVSENQSFGSSSGINFNNNSSDMIGLYKISDSKMVDSFGLFGSDNWANSLGIGVDGVNFRRKNDTSPLPNPTEYHFDINEWDIIDWSSCGDSDYVNIGQYDFSLGVPPILVTNPFANNTNCDTSVDIVVEGSEGVANGQTLAYRWYYLAPNSTLWTEITSDGGPYSGFDQATLTISFTDIVDVNGYQYYCQIRESTETCYIASNAVKINHERAFWDSNTWYSSPDIDKLVVINSDYFTDGVVANNEISFKACNLVVNAGSTLTVDNTTFVEVENDVIVKGNIVVQTQGAFVQNDNSGTYLHVDSGASQVNKFTAPLQNWYDYTYWSSPVENVQIGIALAFANPNRRFGFDANQFLDVNGDDIDDNDNDWVLTNPTDIMDPGKGYAATHDNIGFTPNTSYQYNFNGPFNTGVITQAIYFNATNNDHWNLFGNPYPSAIKVRGANGLFDINSGLIKNAVYLWSHDSPPDSANSGNDVLNFNNNDYAIINGTMEIAGASGIIPGNYIPSGQSFFVSSLASGLLTFNNSMRITGDNSNDLFFGANDTSLDIVSNKVVDEEKLWLNLKSDNGAFSQLGIGYVLYATDNFDGMGIDAKRNLTTGNAAIIYTQIPNSSNLKFAIQGKSPESLTLNEVVPLGFDTSIDEATLYTFSIAQLEGNFLSQNDIFIKDNLLNKIHNLKESDYSFTSEVGEFTDRFEIVFTRETLSVNEAKLDNNSLQIIELPNGDVQFKLYSPFEMKSIEIVDLLGRTLYLLEAQGNSQTFSLSNLSQATYLAKVKLSNGKEITKKAIKRK